MSSFAVSRLGFCFAVAALIPGCGGSNREAPKIPLGQAQSTTSTVSGAPNVEANPAPMSEEFKTALDSGNILYRAKAYDAALAQYRRSAEIAPTESAPLVGILMVADVTKNRKLADSAIALMRKQTPALPDSAAAMSQAEILRIHSGITKAPPTSGTKKE